MGFYANKDSISQIIKDAGFKWRKGRVAPSSSDPNYRRDQGDPRSLPALVNMDKFFRTLSLAKVFEGR
jgi:hypothetical protein